MDNTLADMLNIFTGTIAFLPGLSKFTIFGHTPILLDALSVCSVTTVSTSICFRIMPEIVTTSIVCINMLVLLVDLTNPAKPL